MVLYQDELGTLSAGNTNLGHSEIMSVLLDLHECANQSYKSYTELLSRTISGREVVRAGIGIIPRTPQKKVSFFKAGPFSTRNVNVLVFLRRKWIELRTSGPKGREDRHSQKGRSGRSM